jgi:hypothetical protein
MTRRCASLARLADGRRPGSRMALRDRWPAAPPHAAWRLLSRPEATALPAVPGREGVVQVQDQVHHRTEMSAVSQYEPGHRLSATLPPPPPRREARDELKPAAAFCIAASRPQLRHPRAAPVGDLDPDDNVPGPDGHRDRLSWSTRPAMPDAVAEQLVHQQRGVIPARVPGAEHRAHKRAGDLRALRPPGHRHALPDRQPSHHRTRPSPAALPRETGRASGGRRDMHAQLSRERQAGTTASADPCPWLVRRRGSRPWPSVQSRRSLTPLPAPDSRPLFVRGHRNMTVYSVTR